MSKSYQDFKNKISLTKLKKFFQEHNVTRWQLVAFLNHEEQKVLKSESIDAVIHRINNGFDLELYVFPMLLKMKKMKPKSPKNKFSCTLIFYRRIDPDDDTPYKKT